MRILIAITGASGTIYAQRLLMKLSRSPQVEVLCVVFTSTARKVAPYELGQQWQDTLGELSKIKILRNDDFFTPVASGSNAADAMVIVPCSMGMLGRIAAGVSNDLTARAADVMLKEGRPLVLVPREMPLSLIHLRNMLTLKEAGAVIMPASPSFYSKPETIEQLVDTVVDRILAQLSVENKGVYRWNPVVADDNTSN